ncbi:MAG: glycosyltransferase family 9 protein [Chromatiales bacterium]|nr:glycosyltransferase family 9 protein [Chromatiales bacterium]
MSILLEQPPRSLCLLRLSALGDVCHALPLVRTLQRAWPDCCITWIIGRTEAALMAGLDGVEFIILNKAGGIPAYREVARQLRGRRFDVLLNLHPSMRANLVSLRVRSPRKVGFDRDRAKDQQWLFTNSRIRAVTRQHVMDSFFEFAAALGVAERVERWDIPIPDTARVFADRHIECERRTVVLSPCAAARFRNYRNWPAEHFAAFANELVAAYGVDVVLTGGSSEEEQRAGALIEASVGARCTNLIGRTNLKQLLALIQRADLLVCPDSGPAHMATAVDTPVVALFATTDPRRAAPYLSRNLVVDRYDAACRRFLHKSADEVRFGTRVRNPDAMSLITVDAVMDKVAEVLG